jgi:TPR repeat protein
MVIPSNINLNDNGKREYEKFIEQNRSKIYGVFLLLDISPFKNRLNFEAASKGDTIAQFNLAMMYYNGEHVKQSDKNALTWLTLSAQAGYAMAQVRLGSFYREGYALVKQDYKKALSWYYEAAKQKYPPGEYYVGYCYYYGYGVEEDHKKAAYWMFLAKENGYEHAETFMKRKKLYY